MCNTGTNAPCFRSFIELAGVQAMPQAHVDQHGDNIRLRVLKTPVPEGYATMAKRGGAGKEQARSAAVLHTAGDMQSSVWVPAFTSTGRADHLAARLRHGCTQAPGPACNDSPATYRTSFEMLSRHLNIVPRRSLWLAGTRTSVSGTLAIGLGAGRAGAPTLQSAEKTRVNVRAGAPTCSQQNRPASASVRP